MGANCDLCHTLPPSAADTLLAWIEPAVLESDRARLTSPIALWETVAGLCRSHIFSAESARNRVKGLCNLFGLKIVGIGEREYDLALQAYAEFGQGRHPAALNMGDCFAYACARAHGAALLFKGRGLFQNRRPHGWSWRFIDGIVTPASKKTPKYARIELSERLRCG